MRRVAEFATLNANYLAARLAEKGFELAVPARRASHEFIVTLNKQKQEFELTATDIAKRLLDYGFHAPTVYFPLLVPECLLIEPTESADPETDLNSTRPKSHHECESRMPSSSYNKKHKKQTTRCTRQTNNPQSSVYYT